MVEIGEIDDHSHGGTKASGGLLDGGGRTAHRNGADIEVFSDERDLTCDWILDPESVVLTVVPARYLGPLRFSAFVERGVETLQQQIIVVGKPVLRARAEEFFDHGGSHGECISLGEAGRGALGDGFLQLIVDESNDHRRGGAFFHLTVPVAEEIDCFGPSAFARIGGEHHLLSKKVHEHGVDVLLDVQHLLRLPLRFAIEQRADLARAVVCREIAGDRIAIVFRKRILIRGNDFTAGRVEKSGKIFERNEALPFAVSVRAIGGDVAAAAGRPDRKFSGGMIADVAIRIGVDEVLTGPRESRDGGGEFLPVASAVQIKKGELETARLGRGPAQGVVLILVVEKNGTVASDPVFEDDGFFIFHGDGAALKARLLDLALKKIAAGARIDLFAIEVLNVELEIRYSPCDPLIVSDDDRGHARERRAGDIEIAGMEMDHIPGRGEREFEVRIVGENWFAGCRSIAGKGPRVRAGLRLAAGAYGIKKFDLRAVSFLEHVEFVDLVAPARGQGSIHVEPRENRIADAPRTGIVVKELELDGEPVAMSFDIEIHAARISGENGSIRSGHRLFSIPGQGCETKASGFLIR